MNCNCQWSDDWTSSQLDIGEAWSDSIEFWYEYFYRCCDAPRCVLYSGIGEFIGAIIVQEERALLATEQAVRDLRATCDASVGLA